MKKLNAQHSLLNVTKFELCVCVYGEILAIVITKPIPNVVGTVISMNIRLVVMIWSAGH